MAIDFESLTEATSGAVGALLSTTILYPLDTCKTKYQAEVRSHGQQRYKNLSDVLWEAIATGKVVSLYQGLGTKNVQSFISSFLYFYGYNYFKRMYIVWSGNKAIGTRANLIVAAASAACTVIITHPLDTISSRMQTSVFGKSKGFFQSFKESTWAEAYDGLGISLLLTSNPSIQAVSDPGQATVKFTASNLQTFPPSEAKGKISGDYRPPRDADDSFSKPVAGGGSDEPQSGGWMRIFKVAAYKPYFDVDTSDVLERIKDSLIPFRGNFTEKTANNPDLYGPFWICTTLIFVAASIGTFVTYVAHKLQNKDWDYDINMITWSAGLFYGYVTVVPLCLYIILKYFSAPSGLVQLFCLYGYSLFVFIPASCLSVVPGDIFKWVIAGVAGFMSATFVALNLRAHIMSAGESWFFIVLGIFLLQLALSVALKLYLFTVTV